jgi:hypothetical protein
MPNTKLPQPGRFWGFFGRNPRSTAGLLIIVALPVLFGLAWLFIGIQCGVWWGSVSSACDKQVGGSPVLATVLLLIFVGVPVTRRFIKPMPWKNAFLPWTKRPDAAWPVLVDPTPAPPNPHCASCGAEQPPTGDHEPPPCWSCGAKRPAF